jgi:hypothetical protein
MLLGVWEEQAALLAAGNVALLLSTVKTLLILPVTHLGIVDVLGVAVGRIPVEINYDHTRVNMPLVLELAIVVLRLTTAIPMRARFTTSGLRPLQTRLVVTLSLGTAFGSLWSIFGNAFVAGFYSLRLTTKSLTRMLATLQRSVARPCTAVFPRLWLSSVSTLSARGSLPRILHRTVSSKRRWSCGVGVRKFSHSTVGSSAAA